MLAESFFSSAPAVYGSAAALRLVLLLYGLWQDANSPMKYTDIDYLVFTDAAAAVARGGSPYDTYRYTPLLAWLLLPTTWGTASSAAVRLFWFSSGKLLFAAADLVAGRLLEAVLRGPALGSLPATRARALAAIWLLNPMVATISTRGSSEGLLGVLVAALVWAVLHQQPAPRAPRKGGSGSDGGSGSNSSSTLAAVLLGAAVHLKIYPFIYAPAIAWWLGDGKGRVSGWSVGSLLTPARLRFALTSFAAFAALNAVMFYM
jgi:GPI mannosyltransferase 1 subunit M